MATSIPAELLERVVARAALDDHDGRSGATLERLTLDDGTTAILKRAAAASEIAGVLGLPDAELVLWESGAFDRFPAALGHPIIGKWVEGGDVVTLMRDLGSTIPGWSRTLRAEECDRIFAAASALHRAFVARPPTGVIPFARRLDLLSPTTMRQCGEGFALAPHVLQGWERFGELVDDDIAAAVAVVHDDPAILATAFGDAPVTLLHADLWPVNLALDGSGATFLDWSLATLGPPAFDFTVFLSGAADHCEPSREELIASFRRASGALTDDRTIALALCASLCDLGWNKALDAADHDDPAQRARAAADLEWWVDAARPGLELLRGIGGPTSLPDR